MLCSAVSSVIHCTHPSLIFLPPHILLPQYHHWQRGLLLSSGDHQSELYAKELRRVLMKIRVHRNSTISHLFTHKLLLFLESIAGDSWAFRWLFPLPVFVRTWKIRRTWRFNEITITTNYGVANGSRDKHKERGHFMILRISFKAVKGNQRGPVSEFDSKERQMSPSVNRLFSL